MANNKHDNIALKMIVFSIITALLWLVVVNVIVALTGSTPGYFVW